MIGKEYLYSLHIHDNNGHVGYHWSPFMGEIDWDDFGKALYDICFKGVISLEVNGRPNLPDFLSEYYEISLMYKAKYIAELASGHNIAEK